MSKPIELNEPMHPEARREHKQRVSLVDAFEAEIKLLKEARKTTRNEIQRQVFGHLAASYGRIMDRWVDEKEFFIDTDNMQIKEKE